MITVEDVLDEYEERPDDFSEHSMEEFVKEYYSEDEIEGLLEGFNDGYRQYGDD